MNPTRITGLPPVSNRAKNHLPPLLLLLFFFAPNALAVPFVINVIDDQTNRGVPLVELTTVNHLRFITDSAGVVAFDEPGFMNQRTFFTITSHGYEFPKDGF